MTALEAAVYVVAALWRCGRRVGAAVGTVAAMTRPPAGWLPALADLLACRPELAGVALAAMGTEVGAA